MHPTRSRPASRPEANDAFTILAAVEAFDLPHIWFNAGVLQFLNCLSHQRGASIEVVGRLVSTQAITVEPFR